MATVRLTLDEIFGRRERQQRREANRVLDEAVQEFITNAAPIQAQVTTTAANTEFVNFTAVTTAPIVDGTTETLTVDPLWGMYREIRQELFATITPEGVPAKEIFAMFHPTTEKLLREFFHGDELEPLRRPGDFYYRISSSRKFIRLKEGPKRVMIYDLLNILYSYPDFASLRGGRDKIHQQMIELHDSDYTGDYHVEDNGWLEIES